MNEPFVKDDKFSINNGGKSRIYIPQNQQTPGQETEQQFLDHFIKDSFQERVNTNGSFIDPSRNEKRFNDLILYKQSLYLSIRAELLLQQLKIQNIMKVQAAADRNMESPSFEDKHDVSFVSNKHSKKKREIEMANPLWSKQNIMIDGKIIFEIEENVAGSFIPLPMSRKDIRIMNMCWGYQLQQNNLSQQSGSSPVDFEKICYEFFFEFIEQSIIKTICVKVSKNMPELTQLSPQSIIQISQGWKKAILTELINPSGLENIYHKIIVTVDESKNKNSYCDSLHLQELKQIISKTTFGFNILQGPSNLNSLTFFNVENEVADGPIRRKSPKRKAQSNQQCHISHFQLKEAGPSPKDLLHQRKRMGEQSFANMLQLWKIHKNEREQLDEDFQEDLKKNLGPSPQYEQLGQCLAKSHCVGRSGLKQERIQIGRNRSSFYVEREEMFVCEMSKSNPSPAPAIEVPKCNSYEVDNNDAIAAQKLFTNMVVHDLRNPAEAIRGGLEQAQQLMRNNQQKILNQTERVFIKQFQKRTSSPRYSINSRQGKTPLQRLQQLQYSSSYSIGGDVYQQRKVYSSQYFQRQMQQLPIKPDRYKSANSQSIDKQDHEEKKPTRGKTQNLQINNLLEFSNKNSAERRCPRTPVFTLLEDVSSKSNLWQNFKSNINVPPNEEEQKQGDQNSSLVSGEKNQINNFLGDFSFNQNKENNNKKSSFIFNINKENSRRLEMDDQDQGSSKKSNSLIGIEPEEENIDADEGEQILAGGQNSKLPVADPFDVFENDDEVDFEEKPGANDIVICSPRPFTSKYNDLKSIEKSKDGPSSIEFVQQIVYQNNDDIRYWIESQRKATIGANTLQLGTDFKQELREDEKAFLMELLKDKMNMRALMINYSSFQVNQKAVKEELKSKKSNTEQQKLRIAPGEARDQEVEMAAKIQSQSQKEQIADWRRASGAESRVRANSVAQAVRGRKRYSSKDEQQCSQVACHRCFKISKFMLKQMNELIRVNCNVESYFQNAIFSSLMITNLINELLDQAKLEKSTFELVHKEFNLIEIIRQTFQILIFQADKKNVKLQLQFDRSQPYIFTKIFSDKRRYLQILLNLLSNSIKFSKKNGFVRINLRILEQQQIDDSKTPLARLQSDKVLGAKNQKRKLKKRSSMMQFSASRYYDLADETREEPKYIKLQIEIEDNGVGMEQKDIDKLFKDYSMLNQHKHLNQAGTGLGLSICKNIVNKMGGQIHVESKLNEGSKFIITLQVKAIDKIVICDDAIRMSDKQKVDHLKNLGAYDYTKDFYKKFTLLNTSKGLDSPLNFVQSKQFLTFQVEHCLFAPSQRELYQFGGSTSQSNIQSKQIQSISAMLDQKYQNMHRQQNFDMQRGSVLADQSESQIFPGKKHHSAKIKQRKVRKSYSLQESMKQNGDLYRQRNSSVFQQSEVINKDLNHISHSLFLRPKKSDIDDFVSFMPKEPALGKQKKLILSEYSVDSSGSEADSNNINKKMLEDIPSIAQIKDRKLRFLIANDDPFTLLIVTQMIKSLKVAVEVDQASNGQEALDMVMSSESLSNSLSRPYDVILLDIDMPILTGIQACKQIRQYYKEYQRMTLSLDSMQSGINDLKKLLDKYALLYKKQETIGQKKINQLRFQKFISIAYNRLKYQCLTNIKYPYLFAYSANMTEKIRQDCIAEGFDGCLSSPIALQDIEDLIKNFIDKYVDKFMTTELHKLNLYSQFKVIMSNMDAIEKQKKDIPVNNSIPKAQNFQHSSANSSFSLSSQKSNSNISSIQSMSRLKFTFNEQAQEYIDRLPNQQSQGLQVIQNNLGSLFQSSEQQNDEFRIEDDDDVDQIQQ